MPTTVDKIRRALEKRDGIAEEEMRPLATAYRDQVQQVNQRLDDAVMLLRKGLRSEAIQRVEMTPNALDTAAELEFPEWDDWNEILQFMGIPLPPKLNQDYVAQINEAIIESLPLEALLRRHRRLAIAKAPLSVRLRTLRQIARVDSKNPVWTDDVEVWEKSRLAQVDSELKQALEREDSATLYQLHKELTEVPWRVKPSSRLLDQCAFAAEAHVKASQETELSRVAPQIQEAFERSDEQAVRSLRSQWQAIRATYNAPVSSKLETAVTPAMQWLEDLDRQTVMDSERQIAIDALNQAIASGASYEDVQRAYDHAASFGKPLPADMTAKVSALANQPARQAKRKVMLAGGALAVFVLLAIIGGGLYLQSKNAAATQAETIAQMQRFIQSDQFDEAVRYFESVQAADPDTAAAPRMVALHATAKKAVDDESARQQRFEKLVLQADMKDAALIDESLLPQLEELAASEGERARIDDIRSRKKRYDAEVAIKQSDDMIAEIGQMQRTFAQLQTRGSSKQNRDAVQQLLITVSRLPAKYPKHSEDAAAKQETLRGTIASTLDRMKDASQMSEQRNEAIDALVNARSLTVYSDRLREFSSRSVSRTGFIEFATVIDEEDHWNDVERINDWLAELQTKLEGGVTSSEAVKLIESGRALQADVSPNPIFQMLPGFYETMEEIVGRRVILDEVFTRIAKHPLSRLVTLQADSDDGATNHLIYKTYAEENADRMKRAGSLGVSVVSDAIGGVRNRAFQGPIETILPDPMKSVSELINQKSTLAIDFDQKWEQTFLILVSQVMRNERLDGVVKEWLIYELLMAATRGSERLKQMVPQSIRMLDRRSSVRERWYQSRDSDTDLNADLERILRAELNLAYKRFAQPFQEYQQVAKERLKWIGFLAKSQAGPIEYHVRGALTEQDGKLYVAAAAREGDAETAVVTVGELKQGHLRLTPNPVYQVPGRPLFLFPNGSE